MTKLRKEKEQDKKLQTSYPKFKKVNGKHPLQKTCPDSFIAYDVRTRHGGKVAIFNFDLAKEIGLISKDHPNEMSEELEKSILETFSLVIINEYDQINEIEYPEEDVRSNQYMATRYLQLQHPNKQGKTSGDGRSIWNGQINHKGKSWDVSSCGTGATSLSPATHINDKFYQTGDPTISYGCGYAERDEGFCSIFFSEILKNNHIPTERCLGVIEFKNKLSINIRVHENLIRPSHIFSHLKQGNLEGLKNIVNYYIDTQENRGSWTDVPKTEIARYKYFLSKEVEVFSKMAANFEDHYIFCWLDWDGDNILMDGGIIDYGSIRQFGLYHDEYRYDDVQRYSTSLSEQKTKARNIVQSLAQAIDFLINGERKALSSFSTHKSCKEFDRIFLKTKDENLMFKIGFSAEQQEYLLSKELKSIDEFRKPYSYFEKAKSKEGIHDVADGINWSAIFCMRDILRELPQMFLSRGESLNSDEFIEIIKSSYATTEDLELSSYRIKMISEFQQLYWELCEKVAKHFKLEVNKVLLQVLMRSSIINKYDRVTGDSITTIVNKLIDKKPKIKSDEMYAILKEFTDYQNLDPTQRHSKHRNDKDQSKFVKSMLKIVRTYREGL